MHRGGLRVGEAPLACGGTGCHESLLGWILLHGQLLLELFSLWLACLGLVAARWLSTCRTGLGASKRLLPRVGWRGLVRALCGSVHTRLLNRSVLIDLWLLDEVLSEHMLHHDWLDFGMLEALSFRFSFLHFLS